jgi:hypothetical protein
MSWTEREYRRAIELNIPILAFIREKGATRGDQVDTDQKAQKLALLISDVGSKRLREMWTTPDDLRAKVNLALIKAIAEDEADGTTRPGWYRGNQLPSPATMNELANLSSENRALRAENERLKALLHTANKESTFAVEALALDGSPVTELVFSRVHQEDPQIALGAFTKMDFAQTDDIKWSTRMQIFNKNVKAYLSTGANAELVYKYALGKALRACSRIGFMIRNVKGPTANDVRCNIEFPSGFILHTGELPEPSLPVDRPQQPHRLAADRSEEDFALALARCRPSLEFFTSISVTNPNFSLQGQTLHLRTRKVQHENSVKYMEDDEIVTVLPPADGPSEGELRYRVWSDDTKPREGTIPFRIVEP